MPTENPKISAYVPQSVYDAFNHFKGERSLSMSQAAIVIFAEYFGIDLSKENSQEITDSLPSKLLVVQNKLELLEKLFYDLDHTVETLKTTSGLQDKNLVLLSSNFSSLQDSSDNSTSTQRKLVDHKNNTSSLPDIKADSVDSVSLVEVKNTNDKSNLQLELLSKPSQEDIDKLQPLSAAELTKRFGKPEGFVKGKKFQMKNRTKEFLALLKLLDPQGIGWQYSDQDKKYYPILENQDVSLGAIAE
jgi:hypothetical protein